MTNTQIPEKLRDEKFRFILLRKRDKIPLINNWQTTENYPASDQRIIKHLQMGGNIGMLCSKGVPIVIDFDEEQCEAKVAPKLPRTFTVRSGRGRLHKYYLCGDAENLKILDDKKNTLADIQADRKQIVCPPSIHPNGNEYVVIDDVPLNTIHMAEIKAAFAEYLPKEKSATKSIARNGAAEEIKRQLSWQKILSHEGIDSSRNPTMCPMGHDSKGGACFSYDDTKQVAYCFHCGFGGDVIKFIEQKNNLGFKEAVAHLSSMFGISVPKIVVTKKPKNEIDGPSHSEIAAEILGDTHFLTIAETDVPYFYKGGKYVELAEPSIKVAVENIMGGEVGRHFVGEVIESIKRRTYCSMKDMDADPDWLCVKNGLLNVKTKELKPHSPSFRTFTQLPTNYDASKKCPEFLKFVNQVAREQDVKLIQEMIGYCLYRSYPLHKAIMLTGSGSNGKSTLLNCIKAFLGLENIASVSMQGLEFNRFAPAELLGKLANVYPDLPSASMNETGTFKCLTGGDTIYVERKGRDFFPLTNFAKFLFSANQIPAVKDDTDAFYRRWLIIRFDKKFLKGEADKHLIERITTSDELSGILNWALEGLHRLFQQEDFSENDTIEQVREVYTKLSNPIRAFVMDRLNFDDMESVSTKDELFKAYTAYCREMRLPCLSDSARFFNRLGGELPENTSAVRPHIDGVRVQCIKGVKVVRVVNATPHTPIVGEEEKKEGSLNIGGMRRDIDHLDHSDQLIDANTLLSQIPVGITAYENIFNPFRIIGVPEELFTQCLDFLCKSGQVYQPKPGFYARIE